MRGSRTGPPLLAPCAAAPPRRAGRRSWASPSGTPARERWAVHVLIAAGVVWVCVGTPLACGLGSVLRSATGGDEARWRVLEIADAFLAATARAADALAGGPPDRDAAMHEFVGQRHRAAMARVELGALLGESCEAMDRSRDVLAVLGEVSAEDDGGGR